MTSRARRTPLLRFLLVLPLIALASGGAVRFRHTGKAQPAKRVPALAKTEPGPLTLRQADPTRIKDASRSPVANAIWNGQEPYPQTQAPASQDPGPFAARRESEHNAPHRGRPQAEPVWTGLAPPAESLVEKEDIIAYINGTYGVTFGKNEIDVAPATSAPNPDLPPPVLRLEFGGATVAGTALASADPPVSPEVVPEERRVDYARGPVIERYLLQLDALEQIFVINELPQSGEIVVAVRVTTAGERPADGTVSETLTFGSVPEVSGGDADLTLSTTPLAITINGALIIDGSGRTLRVPLAWSGGQYTITIPSDWVLAAQLPITIDPTIGPNLLIDGSTGWTWGHTVAVAYSETSREWLVVWNEQVGASMFDWDVWAQRVSATTGALVGPPLPVDTGATGAYEAHVAWSKNVNRYLIVWRGDPNDNGSRADQRICGRLLPGGSGMFLGMPQTVGDGPVDDWNPRVAWGNDRFYVVWTAVLSSSNWDIRGAFWSENLTWLADVDPDVTLGDRADYPDVAYSKTNRRFLVVWTSRVVIGQADVRARRVQGDTMALNGNVFTVDQSAYSASHAAVAGKGNDWLVVWDRLTSTSTADITGRLVKNDGSMPFAEVAIGSMSWPSWSSHGGWPALAWDPDGAKFWYVVWNYYEAPYNSFSLRGRAVDSNAGGMLLGATTDTVIAAGPSIDASYAGLAYDNRGNQFLIGYWDSWSPGKIRAQRFSVPTNPF